MATLKNSASRLKFGGLGLRQATFPKTDTEVPIRNFSLIYNHVLHLAEKKCFEACKAKQLNYKHPNVYNFISRSLDDMSAFCLKATCMNAD